MTQFIGTCNRQTNSQTNSQAQIEDSRALVYLTNLLCTYTLRVDFSYLICIFQLQSLLHVTVLAASPCPSPCRCLA